MSRPLCVAIAEPENIEEMIDEARAKWSERLGVPIDEVPWQVVFSSDRPLTEAQYRRGAEIEAEYQAGK